MRKIILFLLLTSCSTIESSVPDESKVYDIAPDLSGFIWGYKVCARKILGICTKKEIRNEKIEVIFKDKIQAKKLYDMNFVLRQRQKPF